MEEFTFTYKRVAYHTLTVRGTEDEAWKLADKKIQDHDWSNEKFETEVVEVREINPNRLY